MATNSTAGLNALRELSQNLVVGTPPVYIFTADGQKLGVDMVMLSLQLRQTEALERMALVLEQEGGQSV